MINIKQIQLNELQTYQSDLFQYSVFNSVNWLSIYQDAILIYGLFNSNNEFIGSFFLYKQTNKGITILSNPPFTPSCGLYFNNPSQSITSTYSFNKKVNHEIAHFINKQNASIKIFSLPTNYIDTQDFFWLNYKVIPNYTYHINLSSDIEAIFSNFSSERKKSIRKAIKDEIVVKKTDNYQLVLDLVLKTFNRKQKKLNAYFLNKILFDFANDTNSFAFVAFKNNIPIACTFCVYDDQRAYYLLGGYDNANKHHGAGPLCMYNSIDYAKQIKLPVFDFEGSMLPEVEKYFRDFGGVLTPYYTINKANRIIEIILKFIKPNIF